MKIRSLCTFNVLFFSYLIAIPAFAETGLLVDKLKEKGFVCSALEGGDLCKISSVDTPDFKYSQPIAMFVPKNVRRPTDLLLHLHGWRGPCGDNNSTSPEQMMKRFQLPQQVLQSSARNSVLIAPMSLGKVDTYKNEFALHFDQFVKWVNSTVDPAQERWTLSGHSAGGSIISSIVSKSSPASIGKIEGIALLDATYDQNGDVSQRWERAGKINPKMKVWSVYNGPTATGSRIIKNAMSSNEVNLERTTTGHCDIPAQYYAEGLRSVLPQSPSSGSSGNTQNSSK